MVKIPENVGQFLASSRIAVAGVSRNSGQAANAVYRKLKGSGYTVFPVNPHASTVEGDACYADIASLPDVVDGVVIVTHPDAASDIVRQCATRGVPRVWFHRSFGAGSVSHHAVQECKERNINCIVGGCPLMFCSPVDVGHRCMRWWLQRSGRVPR